MSGLIDLILQGEHQHQDFKFRIDDAKKIARTLVAFANTEGGRLLIGVKDNGKIVGTNAEEEFYVAQSAAQLYAKPEIQFQSRLWQVEGKTVLEIYIPPSPNRPHLALDDEGKWKAYIRKNDQNLLANGVLYKIWKMGFRDRPAQWAYTPAEQKLFHHLRENGSISLSMFQKLAKLKRNAAEFSIARLVSWKILRMEHTDQGYRFYPENLPDENLSI
jgi:predicted HTH transcriptional regulator